jgi:plastocyanin
MSDFTTKAYPCKRNQEHKQEQEIQSNRLDYEMGSHKSMNGDTVLWQNESKQNPNPKVATATE